MQKSRVEGGWLEGSRVKVQAKYAPGKEQTVGTFVKIGMMMPQTDRMRDTRKGQLESSPAKAQSTQVCTGKETDDEKSARALPTESGEVCSHVA